jgi:hypothetical protein
MCHLQAVEMSWGSDRYSAKPDCGDFMESPLVKPAGMSDLSFLEPSLVQQTSSLNGPHIKRLVVVLENLDLPAANEA